MLLRENEYKNIYIQAVHSSGFKTKIMLGNNMVLLDLMLTNREGPVGDVKVGDSLGCSDHGIVELSIRPGGSRAAS